MVQHEYERRVRESGEASEAGGAAVERARRRKLGNIRFYSATYRLFNIDALEPACEDYGQAVIYKGTVDHHPHSFVLDDHHVIETGKVFPVCGNTWLMLAESRFADHFEFIGNFDSHFGIFEGCGLNVPFEDGSSDAAVGSSCC